MMKLLNKQSDRVWMLSRVNYCISKQPLLFIGFIAYWIWINLALQTPILFHSLSTDMGFVFPIRLAPIACAFITYLAVSIWFKKTKIVIKQPWLISALASIMVIGALITIVWMRFTVQQSAANDSTFSLLPAIDTRLFLALYLVGSFFIGFPSALLCIELQRIFGSLGSQYVLYLGCLSVILSCLILTLFLFLPQKATYALFILDPILIAVCIQGTIKRIASKSFYSHGEDAKLIIPKKLLVTSMLHGLSIGVLIGLPSVAAIKVLSIQSFVGLFVGALLLFTLSILVKMDYNHLLYQVGFPLVALGALALICLSDLSFIGLTIQIAGFSFIHLVMWGVCTYFIANLKLPATWTIGVSTCGFMFGQLLGALTSILAAHVQSSLFSLHNLVAVILFITLFASLLMMSNTNLQTGWGLARLGTYECPEDLNDHALESIVLEFQLTERQTSILLLLFRGRSRRIISEELYISEETVKTHIQQIYKKLKIHSRQELMDICEKKIRDYDANIPKPLFEKTKKKKF